MSMIDDNTVRVIVAVCEVAKPFAPVAAYIVCDWYDRRVLNVGPRGSERPRPSPKAERLSRRRRTTGTRRPRR